MCGENAATNPIICPQSGSSPRVRGKRTGRWWCPRRARLIPACAGKTTPTCSPAARTSAHPRVCGENAWAPWSLSVAVGSSPRVRGKPADPGLRRGSPGLIPACAGKTAPQSPTRCATGAHPRVCGENSRMCLRNISSMGSSPRVRGKQVVEDGHRRRVRLIPACAGKTRPRVLVNRFGGAHPRVCGENRDGHGDRVRLGGSSPRVRGKRWRRGRRRPGPGLIPACAGKTRPRDRSPSK